MIVLVDIKSIDYTLFIKNRSWIFRLVTNRNKCSIYDKL